MPAPEKLVVLLVPDRVVPHFDIVTRAVLNCLISKGLAKIVTDTAQTGVKR